MKTRRRPVASVITTSTLVALTLVLTGCATALPNRMQRPPANRWGSPCTPNPGFGCTAALRHRQLQQRLRSHHHRRPERDDIRFEYELRRGGASRESRSCRPRRRTRQRPCGISRQRPSRSTTKPRTSHGCVCLRVTRIEFAWSVSTGMLLPTWPGQVPQANLATGSQRLRGVCNERPMIRKAGLAFSDLQMTG